MTVTSAIRRPRVIHGEGPREDPSPYSICAAIADALSPLRLAAVARRTAKTTDKPPRSPARACRPMRCNNCRQAAEGARLGLQGEMGWMSDCPAYRVHPGVGAHARRLRLDGTFLDDCRHAWRLVAAAAQYRHCRQRSERRNRMMTSTWNFTKRTIPRAGT